MQNSNSERQRFLLRIVGFFIWQVVFMWTPNLHGLSEWFFQHAALTLAVFVTASAALLIGCAISAVCSPCKEKDRLFHRTVY